MKRSQNDIQFLLLESSSSFFETMGAVSCTQLFRRHGRKIRKKTPSSDANCIVKQFPLLHPENITGQVSLLG